MDDHQRDFQERSLKNVRALLDKLERDDRAAITGRDLLVVGGAIVVALLILAGIAKMSSWYESGEKESYVLHPVAPLPSVSEEAPKAPQLQAEAKQEEPPRSIAPSPLPVAARPVLGPLPASCPKASAVGQRQPHYPRSAIESNQEGWVVIEYDIASYGSTSNVAVLASSPKGVFDTNAIRAIRKWTFPADNSSTGCRCEFEFTLRD